MKSQGMITEKTGNGNKLTFIHHVSLTERLAFCSPILFESCCSFCVGGPGFGRRSNVCLPATIYSVLYGIVLGRGPRKLLRTFAVALLPFSFFPA